MNTTMNRIITQSALGLIIAATMASCGGSNSSEGTPSTVAVFDDMPVVAERVDLPTGGSVIVAHPEKSDDVRILKLSDLAGDARIVRLENSDEALISAGQTWITGNRIVVYSNSVVKQFDFDGKYLGQIGGKGNGPGEYTIAPYDIYVDSKAGRIYMVSYNADKVMSYDSDGTFIENIPLAQKMPKGCIRVDTEKKSITAVAMCFEGTDADKQVWTQDFEGNMLSSVSKPWLKVPMDFSNEVMSNIGSHADGFSYSLIRWAPAPDSVYEYDGTTLRPAFTLPAKDNERHHYSKLGSMFVATNYNEPEEVEKGTFIVRPNTPILVDPESLRGGRCNVMLDCIGDVVWENDWIYTKTPAYFILNTSPGTLSTWIDNSIEKNNLKEDALKKLQDFQATLNEDDNNIVIFAPWK